MKLIIEDDEGRRTVVPFVRDELTIGRNEDSTVRLTEKNVSRKHGRFVREENRFFIEDLNSFTGIRVNGEKIAGKRLVREGDLIQISEYDLSLQAAPEERAKDPAALGDDEPTHVPAKAEAAAPSVPPVAKAAPPPPAPQPAPAPAPARKADPAVEAEAEASARKNAVTAVIRLSDLPASPSAGEQSREIPREKRPRLVGIAGAWRGRELILDRSPIRIGRSDDNDVGIDHPSISRRHCRLHVEGDSWKVMDAESRNGVRVNGEPYAAIGLRNGDIVEVGHLRFLFVVPGAAVILPPEDSVRAAALAAAQHGSPGNRTLVFGLGGALVLAVGVAAFFATRHPRRSEEESVEVVQDSKAERKFALRAADEALTGHRFAEAIRNLDNARNAGATAAELRNYNQTQAEAHSEDLYREMEGAMAAQDYDRARKLLGVLSGSQTYFGNKAAEKADAVTSGYVTLHLAAAGLMKGKDNAGCLSEAQVALAANPQSTDAQSLVDSCKGAPAAAAAPAATRPARATTPPPAPVVAVARVGASEAADAEAKKLVGEGDQKLVAQDFPTAIASYQKALSVKPSDLVLARVYRSMGIAFTRQGNIEEGAHYYKLYLPLCTNPGEKAQLQKVLDDYEARRH